MNLKQVSVKLKELSERENITEEDKTELFETCLMFSQYFFSWKKCCINEDVYEQVTVIAAEQLYIIITAGRRKEDWLKYINCAYMEYFEIRQMLFGNVNSKQPDVKDLGNKFQPIVKARYTQSEVNQLIDKHVSSDNLWALYKELNSYIRTSNKFSSNIAVLNARISIQLSIKYGRFINFRLTDVDLQLCRFLYNKFCIIFKQLSKLSAPVLSDEHFARVMANEVFIMNNDLVYEIEEW